MTADETPATTDYSEWLTPERLEIEERLWAEVGIHSTYATEVIAAAYIGLQSYNRRNRELTVLEVGCGTGWTAMRLHERLKETEKALWYVGVDANEGCLRLARTKSPGGFVQADIRTLAPTGDPETDLSSDVVCAFAVFKHFALAEWKDIVVRVLKLGRAGVFTMNVGDQDLDDFSNGFPHTWVSTLTLAQAVDAAGHTIVSMRMLETGETVVRTAKNADASPIT